MMITVEHQIIHNIKFSPFSRGRTNSWKLHVVKMDGGDSPNSTSAKFKLIASVVAEKNMFLDLHLYEHLKLGRLWNNSIVFFMNRKGEKYKQVLYNFTCGDHISKVYKYKSRLIFVLKWINELSTEQILYYHNFTTTQAIFKQNRLAWSHEYVGSQKMKITCSENAWDFKFPKIWCSEFCMLYSNLSSPCTNSQTLT